MSAILCYGDSNTHGTMPILPGQPLVRYERGIPWPDKMSNILGSKHIVISEGLPGRTTVHDDPIGGGMRSGIDLLPAILKSHEPLDLLIIMLGTNDLKPRFLSSSLDIAQSVDRIVKESQWYAPGLDVMIISPASVIPNGTLTDVFFGAEIRQKDLSTHLQNIASMNKTGFMNADDYVKVSPIDGVHWDEDTHNSFGIAAAQVVLDYLNKRRKIIT
tara:strand:- start:3327 stop:3974 length:648 start_codon:yes stop_codon:yes gene_type:complete